VLEYSDVGYSTYLCLVCRSRCRYSTYCTYITQITGMYMYSILVLMHYNFLVGEGRITWEGIGTANNVMGAREGAV